MEETENMDENNEYDAEEVEVKKAQKVHQKSTRAKAHKRAKARPKAVKAEHKDDEGISKIRIGIAVAILIVLVLVIIFYSKIFPSQGDVVAIVNGEEVTAKEFNSLYARIPDLYKQAGLTEMSFLNDTLILNKILLQEANKKGISVADSEIEETIANVLSMNGINKSELDDQLKQQNMTYDDFRQMSKEQLMITKLLNATVPAIEITEQETKDFYNSNKNLFAASNTTFKKFDEVKAKIRDYLASKKFMEDVRNRADVQIFLIEEGNGALPPGNLQEGGSFSASSEDVCMENGRPLVILFSTTTCPHCKWIKNTFDYVAKEYADAGRIAAYHWELDTGDNTLTAAKESSIPESYSNMFWKYSQKGGVPAFMFGCKYYRIGNAYESSGDLDAEEKEFRSMLDSLAAG